MSNRNYIPSPVDTSGTAIPEDIRHPAEDMARNTAMEALKFILSKGYRIVR